MKIPWQVVWSKLHDGDQITHVGHGVLTLLILTMTFIGMSIPVLGDHSYNAKIGVGVWASVVHWVLHELGNIIPVWLAAREARATMESELVSSKNVQAAREAEELLTAKLTDGLGDLLGPALAIALFVAITYPLFGV